MYVVMPAQQLPAVIARHAALDPQQLPRKIKPSSRDTRRLICIRQLQSMHGEVARAKNKNPPSLSRRRLD